MYVHVGYFLKKVKFGATKVVKTLQKIARKRRKYPEPYPSSITRVQGFKGYNIWTRIPGYPWSPYLSASAGTLC